MYLLIKLKTNGKFNYIGTTCPTIRKQPVPGKETLSFEEACAFLNFSKSYLYKLTSAYAIPHYKPNGKMIYFEREELEKWLRQNPVKTKEHIEMDANAYIMKHRHGKK